MERPTRARPAAALAAGLMLALVPITAAPASAAPAEDATTTSRATVETPAIVPISAISAGDIWLPIEPDGGASDGLGDAELLPDPGQDAVAHSDLTGDGEVAGAVEAVSEVDAEADPAAEVLSDGADEAAPSVTVAASLVLATALVTLALLGRRGRSRVR